MGNPTDELRAKLSEHGIEYEVVDRDVEQNTFWNLNGVRYKYNALVDSQHGCLSICCANFLTPEQAIAATVGAGTCRNEWAEFGKFRCSECGLQVDSISTNTTTPIPLRYCPNCGRRLASE